MLSRDRFDAARRFIEENARPVENAQFAHRFGSRGAGDVLDALAAYQNPDGGIGNALEADIRFPASSPMATSVGLQIAGSVDATADHPVVAGMIGYLLRELGDGDAWHATSVEVNDWPHAPWWHVEALEPVVDATWANPNVELLGWLCRWRGAGVPDEVIERLCVRAERVRSGDGVISAAPEQLYSMLTWQRAAPYLPGELGEGVNTDIKTAFEAAGAPSAESLGHMNCSWFAHSPDTPWAVSFPEAVDALLEAEISAQAEDGGWWPGWQWGEEETWSGIAREWAGKMTGDTLEVLRRFGKIEGL